MIALLNQIPSEAKIKKNLRKIIFGKNLFCPRCHGLFFPKSTRQANIDGAYFGTTFPHLYLMTHPVRIVDCAFL